MKCIVKINALKGYETFTIVEFKRWEQKILFYFTTPNLTKFLHEDTHTVKENEIGDHKMVTFIHGNSFETKN